MNSELLAFLFKLIIVPAGFFMIWVQDKFTWTLYRKYHELWEKVGAPGGIFWCPEGRGFRVNIMMTGRFWFDNQLGLETEATFPEDVRSLYKLYIKIFSSSIIIFVLFVITLLGLHFHETGGVSSQSLP